MIERLHPGVFVTEIPTSSHPIDGVSTSAQPSYATLVADQTARLPRDASPEWTDFSQSDPGVTLLELFAFLGESALFRASPLFFEARLRPPSGMVQGLEVESSNQDATPTVHVSHGLALGPDGRPVEPVALDCAIALRPPKP